MNKDNQDFLAKPSGITLAQHIKDVVSEGLCILNRTPFVVEKYQNRVGKDLKKRLEIICECHDDGKKNPVWQTACQKDYQEYLSWKKKKNCECSFAVFALENKSLAGKNIRGAGIRHEIQSLVLNERRNMPLSLQCAIAAHHAKLGFCFEERWRAENLSLWKRFLKESNRVIEEDSLKKTADIFYEYAGLRGLLQLSDHRASAKEDNVAVPDVKCFSYKFPFENKRHVQKMVEDNWEKDLLLVRAPTGAGKTDACLLWASKQIANKRADRLIIAMPTRFTSNALEISVSESLSDTGLYHSSAWYTKFQNQVDEGVMKFDAAKKNHEFARLLETPVTVCTIDHLLMSLTLTREDHQMICFNLSHSCVVIDEADFYDEFVQANINVLLEILHYWNVPVMIMSASLPESVVENYKKTGYNVDGILEDKDDFYRTRFKVEEIRNYSEISDIEDLLKLCVLKRTAILYANTVDKAIAIYKWFEQYNYAETNKVKPILYHSHYTESDKKEKEQELIDALGKKAWQEGRAEGIAILTQIGEMSINISADIMISEICPIDRLTQRTGRICRFDDKKVGSLFVIIPQKNDSIYPAPYGTFEIKTKTWMPCKSLLDTISVLDTGVYNAEKLVALLNDIYSDNLSFSNKAQINADNLKNYFSFNWMINSKQISNEDDDSLNYWKSRDITAQDSVYVCKPDNCYFTNYLSFQNWKICHSVELPVYLIEIGRRRHRIESFEIKVVNEFERINVIREGFYNYQIGVDFIEQKDSIW